ncbi:MAG: PRC-barrel domain-containing protein [Acetobacteraceae bacterium]|nr:PRC-barrel domain-containing protein [Acetobacteraceae bacterium]
MRTIFRAVCIASLATGIATPALSQGTPQTLSMMRIDPASLATGYRSSKLVGSKVYNDGNEAVGTIDDLIVTPNDRVPYAVLSVGGFIGIGSKLVVVPFNLLEVKDNKMVLGGASKDSLKALMEFKYSN